MNINYVSRYQYKTIFDNSANIVNKYNGTTEIVLDSDKNVIVQLLSGPNEDESAEVKLTSDNFSDHLEFLANNPNEMHILGSGENNKYKYAMVYDVDTYSPTYIKNVITDIYDSLKTYEYNGTSIAPLTCTSTVEDVYSMEYVNK
ncbi:MAG: hypothetical protein J0H68_02475 [Sphingobacteriia bacterium]|nr:hypothetical protein [Sphingobacteriia bacterium]